MISASSMKRFLSEKKGAMTVEWIAIAAAVTIGAIAVTWSTLNNLDPVATRIGTNLNDAAGTVTPPSGP